MIELDRLSIGYDNRQLLNDASTSFNAGQLTALIGRNGSGKSTLLRAIAGLNRNYSGTIKINGTDISTLKPASKARTLAFVNTSRTRVQSLRCRDVVALGRAPYTNWIGHMQPGDADIVDRSLEAVSMSGYANRTMDTMSDGECQRVMIARALAQETPVILLDEPTSFLDMPARHELVALLKQLAHEKGKCILFSTHELDIATKYCDSIALIADTQLSHLPTDEITAARLINRAFNLPE